MQLKEWKHLGKNFCLSILAVTVSTVLYAQQYPKKFSTGFELGLLATQVDGDSYGGYDKASLEAHLMLFTNSRSAVTWNFGIGAAQRGSFFKSDPKTGINRTYKIALHYLSVPVNMRIELGEQLINKKRYQFFTQIGPQFMFNIGAYEKDESGRLNGRPEFQKFTFDGHIRIGIQQEKWSVDMGFGYSLRNIREMPSPILIYDSNKRQHNKLVGLRFSYKL